MITFISLYNEEVWLSRKCKWHLRMILSGVARQLKLLKLRQERIFDKIGNINNMKSADNG